jgi:hypothetical protein
MAKLEQIIVTSECRGKGVEEDVCRTVTKYWTTDGVLLAESDPCAPKYQRDGTWMIPKGTMLAPVVDNLCQPTSNEHSKLTS